MRTLVLACLLSLYGSLAQAQAFETSKPILCDKIQSLVESLTNEYDEKPVWTARNPQDKSKYVLFLNSQTLDWTLLQMNDEVACIIGVGKESRFHWERV